MSRASDTMARMGLDRQLFVSWLAVVVPLVVTGLLWFAAELRTGRAPLASEMAQLLGLFSLIMLAMALLIAARSRIVEEFYGGLDRSYRTHGELAKVGILAMLLHPLMLIPDLWGDWAEIRTLIVPGATLPKTLGITGYWLFVVLVGLTLKRVLNYQRWWSTHRAMGIAFLLSGLHGLMAYSDVRYFGPLRSWIGFWFVIGLIAWLYKTFFYERLAPRHAYRVESIRDLGGDVHDLVLTLESTRLNFAPGEFAFLSVRGHASIDDEHHPLSIASAPHTTRLRFGFKALGDWTRTVANLKRGDQVVVYGPYGEFHSYNLHHHAKQVWIGGGIGITPFLSMLAHESINEDNKQIWLYYAVNDPRGAVFHEELEISVAQNRDDDVRYACVMGERITAERIARDVGDLSDVAILMCGPTPMMRGLQAEFEKLGVPRRRIYFEDFNFF